MRKDIVAQNAGRSKFMVRPLFDLMLPMFVVATETDHIAPWKSVYKTQLFTDCDLTFVLASGGHNTEIVNAPAAKRGHFRIAAYTGPDA